MSKVTVFISLFITVVDELLVPRRGCLPRLAITGLVGWLLLWGCLPRLAITGLVGWLLLLLWGLPRQATILLHDVLCLKYVDNGGIALAASSQSRSYHMYQCAFQATVVLYEELLDSEQ